MTQNVSQIFALASCVSWTLDSLNWAEEYSQNQIFLVSDPLQLLCAIAHNSLQTRKNEIHFRLGANVYIALLYEQIKKRLIL